jgi:hypothetical protein
MGLNLSCWCRQRTSSEAIVGLRPVFTPRSLAAAMPFTFRSRCKLVSNSASTVDDLMPDASAADLH